MFSMPFEIIFALFDQQTDDSFEIFQRAGITQFMLRDNIFQYRTHNAILTEKLILKSWSRSLRLLLTGRTCRQRWLKVFCFPSNEVIIRSNDSQASFRLSLKSIDKHEIKSNFSSDDDEDGEKSDFASHTKPHETTIGRDRCKIFKSPHGVTHSLYLVFHIAHCADLFPQIIYLISHSSITLLCGWCMLLNSSVISILSRIDAKKAKVVFRCFGCGRKSLISYRTRLSRSFLFANFPLDRLAIHSITIASDRASYDNYLLRFTARSQVESRKIGSVTSTWRLRSFLVSNSSFPSCTCSSRDVKSNWRRKIGANLICCVSRSAF